MGNVTPNGLEHNSEKLMLSNYESYDPQVDFYINSKAMSFGKALPIAYTN